MKICPLSIRLVRAVASAGFLLSLAAPAAAQLVTEDLAGPLTPEGLVQLLVGEGVSVSNVFYAGADVAAGRFTGGAGIIGFDAGVILGSGDIALVVGPNDSMFETGMNATPGDSDLDEIVSPYQTNDAAVLEFDFVPRGDTVSFEYVFSSEEYPDFVGTPFNDVFAFFVNGVNYALVADDEGVLHPVAINTINNNPAVGPPSLAVYYINNHPNVTPPYGPLDTEMNGLTVVLTLTAPVNPGVVNRMKLAIADTSDTVLDSNVFIRAGSLRSLAGVGQVTGRLVHVAGVARRSTDGEVDRVVNTGNLFITDLVSSRVEPVTDYPDAGAGSRVILNPSFSPDGGRVLYTARVGAGARFRVYLVNDDAFAFGADYGVLAADPAYDLSYAGLSPDYDERTDPPSGQLAYTREVSASRTELWVRDFATGLDAMVFSQNGLVIRHPVFTAPGVIAFVGLKSGIQDIYSVTSEGAGLANRTGNILPSPQYGRLRANWRAPGQAPRLIYARRVHTGVVYGPWLALVHAVPAAGGGQAAAVTGAYTPTVYDPCFYGDTDTDPVPEDLGLFFYQADTLGYAGLWQSNYNVTDPVNSDTWRTARSPAAAALPDWGPAGPADEPAETAYGLAETRIFFVSGARVARADYLGEGWAVQYLNSGLAGLERNPALDGGGGRLLFESPAGGFSEIYRALNDVSEVAQFVAPDAGFAAVAQPALSACGRFALYLNLAAAGDLAGPVYYAGPGAPAGAPLIAAPDAQDPSFNPELTQVLYRRTGLDPADEGIYLQRIYADQAAGTLTALGAPVKLTASAAGVANRQPAFSPDGRHIAFISNRWLEDNLFLMDASRGVNAGPNAVRVAQGSNLYPVFGPADDDPDNWRLAWVRGGEIMAGLVSRTRPGPATALTATGLLPDPGSEKFAWAVNRPAGVIYARRYLPARAPAGGPVTYAVSVDIDRARVPESYIYNETVPDDWLIDPAQVTVDGAPADPAHASFVDNGDGTRTLRVVFASVLTGVHGRVDSCLLVFPFTVGAREARVSGQVNYLIAGEPMSAQTAGNRRLEIGNPFLPIDLYTAGGLARTDQDPAAIDDFDLLAGIDAWARDARLPGHGAGWPLDNNNWDGLILAAIDIWLGPPGTLGWYTGDLQVTAASQSAGEYTWIEPGEYQYNAGYAPVAEMYWTQGRWDQP